MKQVFFLMVKPALFSLNKIKLQSIDLQPQGWGRDIEKESLSIKTNAFVFRDRRAGNNVVKKYKFGPVKGTEIKSGS